MTHFCVGACVVVAACLSSALVGGNWLGGLCGRMGKALLYMMLWIMFSSVSFFDGTTPSYSLTHNGDDAP